jgi:hypothetical protein
VEKGIKQDYSNSLLRRDKNELVATDKFALKAHPNRTLMINQEVKANVIIFK